jgi:hypothetical protein
MVAAPRRIMTAVLFLLAGIYGLGSSPGPLFRDVAQETGLVFHHFNGATGAFFMPEIMGAGVAVFDYDRDGDLDVFLVQGVLLDGSKTFSDARFPAPQPFKPGHRLFRNELAPGGKLRFTDVTDQAGIGDPGYGMGVAAGDYDNDGDVDLYVTHFGPNRLFRNNSNGTFSDVTSAAGVEDDRWSTSAAFLDFDRDGDLDLFVTNYVDFTIKGNKTCHGATGEIDYCTPAAYRPVTDRLFRNEGQGKFRDTTALSRIGSSIGPGLGVTCSDLNGDGWTDIYVANDGAANFLWINKHDGTFEESALESGAAYAMDGIPRAGMGVTAGDFDNDGDDDIAVTNLRREGMTLLENRGNDLFHDATEEYALARPTFLYTGFGTQWVDYDNDGWLDLFVVNGAVTILETLRGSPYPFQQRNLVFHNEGPSRRFRDVTDLAGDALKLIDVSRGAAMGDIDNDGDLDIVVSNNNGPARLFLNEAEKRTNWLQIRLEGVRDNYHGIGARVGLRWKDGQSLWRQARSDGSYLSASDVRVHFGFGSMRSEPEAVEVLWPSGLRERWQKIRGNLRMTLRQGTGTPVETEASLK